MAPLTHIARLLRLTWIGWLSHDASRIGAALAYYTLLSLAPLVILSLAAGSLLFSGSSSEQHLLREIQGIAGPDAAEVVKLMAAHTNKPGTGVLASALALGTLLLGASGVFVELREALNTMWDIQPQGGSGWSGFLKERLLSVGMVLAVGFLLVVSLVITALLDAVGTFFGGLLPVPVPVLQMLNILISYCGVTFVFALVLRYVPDARLPWREVGIGAGVSAFLFTFGKAIIALYLGRTAVGSLYGGSGSLVAVTVWVYYSAQLFLFGAEFTRVYGKHIRPFPA